jgi:hypothetical protein
MGMEQNLSGTTSVVKYVNYPSFHTAVEAPEQNWLGGCLKLVSLCQCYILVLRGV